MYDPRDFQKSFVESAIRSFVLDERVCTSQPTSRRSYRLLFTQNDGSRIFYYSFSAIM